MMTFLSSANSADPDVRNSECLLFRSQTAWHQAMLLGLYVSEKVTQKEDPKLVFKTDYRLVKVKSFAECSPLGAFYKTFDLH